MNENSLVSKFKNLIVSGCSFTYNEHHTHIAWGNILAAWAGMNITNLAVNGAGNQHIANSIILYLEKNKPSPDDTLIMVMWSGLERVDWITDRSVTKDSDFTNHTYHYDEFNELTIKRIKHSHIASTFSNFLKYQSQQSLTLASWLAMMSLTTYLKNNNYKFYYTSYYDIFDTARGDYENILATLDLTLDKTDWINLISNEYLGNFVIEKNLTAHDGWHPTIIGQEVWTEEILVPKLINIGLISESTPQ
jgi:hypothetical protein